MKISGFIKASFAPICSQLLLFTGPSVHCESMLSFSSAAIQPKNRVFVVGCPRSGTTLLQSFLSAHPAMISAPESHFFRKVSFRNPIIEATFGQLGFISIQGRSRLLTFASDVGKREQLPNYLSRFSPWKAEYIEAFVALLDDMAAEQGAELWIEKTPGHIRHIEFINDVVERAKFIHILRQGKDVVASLYEATHNYPQYWGGKPFSIDKCIDQWNTSIEISQCYQNHPQHLLVSYENLVDSPEAILKNLCSFLSISFDNCMIENRAIAAKNLVLKQESWKDSVNQPIVKTAHSKFERLFDSAQQLYIENNISPQCVVPIR